MQSEIVVWQNEPKFLLQFQWSMVQSAQGALPLPVRRGPAAETGDQCAIIADYDVQSAVKRELVLEPACRHKAGCDEDSAKRRRRSWPSPVDAPPLPRVLTISNRSGFRFRRTARSSARRG